MDQLPIRPLFFYAGPHSQICILVIVYRCMFCFLVSYDYYINACFNLRMK